LNLRPLRLMTERMPPGLTLLGFSHEQFTTIFVSNSFADALKLLLYHYWDVLAAYCKQYVHSTTRSKIDTGHILQVRSKILVQFPIALTMTQQVSVLMHPDCKLSLMSQLLLLQRLMHPSQFNTHSPSTTTNIWYHQRYFTIH